MFSRELVPSTRRTEGAVCGHFQTSQPSPQPGQRQEVLFIGNIFWHQMHHDMQTLWKGYHTGRSSCQDESDSRQKFPGISYCQEGVDERPRAGWAPEEGRGKSRWPGPQRQICSLWFRPSPALKVSQESAERRWVLGAVQAQTINNCGLSNGDADNDSVSLAFQCSDKNFIV